MPVRFKTSSQFDETRIRIEDHLYASNLEITGDEDFALRSVGRFASSIDELAEFLEKTFQTRQPTDSVSEKSHPICDGLFRVFYLVNPIGNEDFEITFLDVDHNKQSNLDRFPTHALKSFDDEN